MVLVLATEETLILPWEKQHRETPRAFAAFKTYRDLPPVERSLAKAVVQFYGEDRKSESKLRQFKEWSSKNAWVVRASAWDDFKDKEQRKIELDALRDMNKRHVQMGKALQQKAIERLVELKSDELTVPDLLAFINAGYRIERTSLGVNDTKEETHVEVKEIEADLTDIPTIKLRHIIASKLALIPPKDEDGKE